MQNDTKTEVVFEEPPLAHSTAVPGDFIVELRAACVANPGKWAVYKRNANAGTAGWIKTQASIPGTPWNGFETTSRGKMGQPRTIYVRYVGNGEAK